MLGKHPKSVWNVETGIILKTQTCLLLEHKNALSSKSCYGFSKLLLVTVLLLLLLLCNLFVSLQFLDQERIVTASSTGAVTIYRHHQSNNQVHTRVQLELYMHMLLSLLTPHVIRRTWGIINVLVTIPTLTKICGCHVATIKCYGLKYCVRYFICENNWSYLSRSSTYARF